MGFSQEMEKTKETKNTVVYKTDDLKCATDTLYIKKTELPNPPPKQITITVAY